MHGSEGKDDAAFYAEPDPRSKLFPRVMGSLAIVGLMVGLMIGRLTTPDPSELQQVEVMMTAWWCGSTMNPSCTARSSTAPWRCCSRPKARRRRAAQAQRQGRELAYAKSDGGLLLTLVAARPLQGEWTGSEVDDRWRLEIHLRSNKRGNPRPACTKVPKTGGFGLASE
jgi:hypothetical protein